VALNRGWIYRSQVGPAAAGRSLLAHLAIEYPHSGRDAWLSRLASGELTVDSRVVDGNTVLRAGQHITWQRPPWDEPDVPLTYSVVYEDAAVVVVDKPAGLPTMPAGGFLEHTLWHIIRDRFPDAMPVHRLGRFTSGLVLCARSHSAAAALGRAWRDRQVGKRYRALVLGHPSWSSLDVATPIGPVAHPRLGLVHAASAAGKPAHSHVAVVGRRGDHALVDVRITTGRPHQIRIHLAAAGHPLVGDPLYAVGGVPRPDRPALPGDGGYHLHAYQLHLAHPTSGAFLALEAPLPPALT